MKKEDLVRELRELGFEDMVRYDSENRASQYDLDVALGMVLKK